MGVSSFLLPRWSRGSDSGLQVWWPEPLPTEPSHLVISDAKHIFLLASLLAQSEKLAFVLLCRLWGIRD